MGEKLEIASKAYLSLYYQGEWDTEPEEELYPIGKCIADENREAYINIKGKIVQHKLLFEFTIKNSQYSEEFVSLLAKYFVGNIRNLINICANDESKIQTLSDVLVNGNDLNNNDIAILNGLFD